MSLNLSVDQVAVAQFCRKHHIRRLSLFRSAVKEGFRSDSGVDVLADFDPEHIPALLELQGMEDELSGLFGGRTVDLVTPGFLSPLIRSSILAEAQVQYAGS